MASKRAPTRSDSTTNPELFEADKRHKVKTVLKSNSFITMDPWAKDSKGYAWHYNPVSFPSSSAKESNICPETAPGSKVIKLNITPPSTPEEKDSMSSVKSSVRTLPMDKSFDGPPLRVLLGEANEEVWIHRSVACAGSVYFDRMMQSGMQETRDNCVTLTDIEPFVFKIYQQFLYTGKIDTRFADLNDTHRKLVYDRLILCYALGDRLIDTNFKDAVVDTIITNSNLVIKDADNTSYSFCPFGYMTTSIYEITPPGSALRRLVVDQHVHHGVPGWISESPRGVYDKTFLYDLAVALLEVRAAPTKSKAPDRAHSTCHYHEHDKDRKKCYKA